jgi:hypothetical protein
MQPEEYQNFTNALYQNLERDQRVIGLVAVGSMAQQDYQPDRWSDHDFFVVVAPGEKESFRSNLNWLPQASEIVLSYRETLHGLKVVYRSGNLLEFAVFDNQEMYLAKVNRYRVLLDRANIEQQVAQIKAASTQPPLAEAEETKIVYNEFGEFLTNLLVGVGRHNRGEKLSGRQFVKAYALRHLLVLLEKYLPASQKALLDNLDPFRRFEKVYPGLGEEINNLLESETPAAARGLLSVAERELAGFLPSYPQEAVQVIFKALD